MVSVSGLIAETRRQERRLHPLVIERYAEALRENGYVVIPRERRVILQANYVLPPLDVRHRIGKERLADMIQREQERTFARKLFESALTASTHRTIYDPVTGTEEVFTSVIALIKPKAGDEV